MMKEEISSITRADNRLVVPKRIKDEAGFNEEGLRFVAMDGLVIICRHNEMALKAVLRYQEAINEGRE